VYEDTEASDLAEDNDLVAFWGDQSGNNLHLVQGTGGNCPTYRATGFNGSQPAIDFGDASGVKFLANGDAALAGYLNGTNDPITIFVTATYTSGNFRFLCVFRDNGGSTHFRFFTDNASKIAQDENGGQSAVGTNAISNGNRRFAWMSGSGTCSAYVDATLEINGASFSATTANLDQLLIGTSQLGSLGWSGLVTEIVIYSAKLNATDWANYRTYSAATWGS
jgi:hypothetical protein